ncbi:MAG: tetratricopeptide repeat protein [Candidatus Zapsychrus exili]|nr:tetratricopeptide repeat protein [Candidatus Zapsychrus exili]
MHNLRIIKKYTQLIFILFAIQTIFFLGASTTFAQNNKNELFSIAQKAFDDGFYDVAIRYTEQLLERYPQTEKIIQAKLLLGQCYFFKSQYLKAYEIFNELLQYSEFKDVTLFWLGETYLKGSDYTQAEQQYNQLIKVYPDSIYVPQAYYSLGWSYFEQNNFKKAKEILNKLLQTFPMHQLSEDASFKLGEIAYNLKDYKSAINLFEKYIATYPQSTRHAESYFYIGESFYSLGDYLTSITYYAKSAEISLDDKLIIMSKVSLGWGYLKLGRHQLAEKSFNDALDVAQQKGILSDDVFLGQATLYAGTGDNSKALEAYKNIIKSFPSSQRIKEAYLGRANTYYLLKKYAQAIESYDELINKFSEDESSQEIVEKAYFGLAWSHLKSGDLKSSINSFETIKNKTKSQSAKISALTQIGDAYQDANMLDKAIEAYDQVLKDYPNNPYTDYVQYRQGIALLKMDKIESATLSFQGLEANFPQSNYLNDIKYYLAVIYFKKEDWTSAKEQVEDFIDGLPESHEFLAESYYILALSQFNLQKYDEAIKTYNKIIKNYPYQSTIIKSSEIAIAKCLYKKGSVNEALKRFNLLINKFPNSSVSEEAIIWLGDHYLEISNFATAIKHYSVFMDTFPESKKLNLVKYQLGQAYQALEKYDAAVNILKEITDKNRELYAKARLAIAHIFSRDLNDDKAVETYKSIIETSPELKRDAYVKIAAVYKRNQEYSKALDSYANALKSDKLLSSSQNSEIQFSIGDTYELLNNTDKAVEEYLKIPYLYQNQISWIIKSYLRVGRIFEDKEKWEEAKIIYKKIVGHKTDESKFAYERIEWIEENSLEIKQ